MSSGGSRQESAYHALARELRDAILRNSYPEGTRLPTEAELAAEHGLSRQTVRRAFQDLVAEGVVYRVPGRGTFVTPKEGQYLRQFGSVEDLMGLAIDTDLVLISALQRRVEVAAAGRLRQQSDVVATATFRRVHDGVPFCETTVYLPVNVARLLEDVPELTVPGTTSKVTVIGLLDARLQHPITEAEQSITATVAGTGGAAAPLEAPAGQALLRIDRIYYDSQEQPVELAVSHFLTDHYSYRVKLRRSIS
jgi:DNA-binding GntR family transcriptional regulator